ncbi:hypothetical protein NKW84_13530 [Acetobacter senegalensis]|uniref:Surface antigen variable number repeat protein n=1 Tax=Acetobacter tropicalis NBRC 101654 TaxID=749388 RepID=F7VHL0_9PROT|nr:MULTISPECIES: POTRA domain-containing protein [Acetobacter]MCP1196871.1 hypothetical protein [Acetobacter senegalensis]GAA09855.1 surface antigen variable number repeat protein [Acetobacter tropicalis NBRC 101654]
MRNAVPCAVIGFALLGAAIPAWAQTPTSIPPSDAPSQTPQSKETTALPPVNKPLVLKQLTIAGNQRIPSNRLMAAVPFHVGDTISQSRITEGLQDVMKVYQQENVGGKFHQNLKINGKDVIVEWTVEETGAAADPVRPLKLESADFTGNLHISTANLRKALHIQPGGIVTPAEVLSDEKSVQAMYVKKNIGVTIVPEVRYPHHDDRVAITYHVTERAPD